MRHFTLLNDAVVFCPSGLESLRSYSLEYPEASFHAVTLEEVAKLFFVGLDDALLRDIQKAIPLSEEGVKFLLSLLPDHPASPRLQAIAALPLPKKVVPKDFFQGKNVVILGYHPLAGTIFASILQNVPNLSSSWGPEEFGRKEGLGVPMLLELYQELSGTELQELCLPSKERFVEARKEEKSWKKHPVNDSKIS